MTRALLCRVGRESRKASKQVWLIARLLRLLLISLRCDLAAAAVEPLAHAFHRLSAANYSYRNLMGASGESKSSGPQFVIPKRISICRPAPNSSSGSSKRQVHKTLCRRSFASTPTGIMPLPSAAACCPCPSPNCCPTSGATSAISTSNSRPSICAAVRCARSVR